MTSFFEDEPFDGENLSPAPAGVGREAGREQSGSTLTEEDWDAAEHPTRLAAADERHGDDYGDGDDDFIPKPPFRFTTLSISLIALIVVGAGFIGGVLVQKQHDKGSTATRAGTATGRTGGFTAGGGFGAGAGTGTGGASTAQPTTGATTPAVIGTLKSLSGKTLIVQNLGGKSITVQVSATTTVTTPFGGALKAGETVSVVGSTATNGAVSASSVTVNS